MLITDQDYFPVIQMFISETEFIMSAFALFDELTEIKSLSVWVIDYFFICILSRRDYLIWGLVHLKCLTKSLSVNALGM